jgi:hypothetical protein
MSRPETERLKIPAYIAGGFLAASLLFSIGFAVAQMDSVKNTQEAIQSGRLQAEFQPYAKDPIDKNITVRSDVLHALQGGAVLISTEFATGLALLLIDEQGKVLHRWHMENRVFNSMTLQWWKVLPHDMKFVIEDAHLLPGGDVIFVQVMMGIDTFGGQRLARMDSNSHVLWEVPGNFHHFINIAGRPQRIYTLRSTIANSLPDIAPKLKGVSYLNDWVDAYSMDGKKIGEWSIVDAFVRSPYRNWLSSFGFASRQIFHSKTSDGRTLMDFFHVNSVQYLDAKQAKALPLAQEGDLLLSFRGLSALAVLRPSTGQIVWATKGPWFHQHNAEASEDGKLYIYDNDGKEVTALNQKAEPEGQMQSRVIRYNPFNNQMDEIFASRELYSYYMGHYQQLPNGSWIIDSPHQGRVVVVSPEKKIVWQMRTVPDFITHIVPGAKSIATMHYYPATALEFLHQPDSRNTP